MAYNLNYIELRRLFFGVCIPLRVALAFLLYKINQETVDCGEDCVSIYLVIRWLVGIAIVVFLMHMIYFEFQRERRRGFFGGLIWWNSIRKVHILNYFAVAMFLWFNKYGSHYFLFADVAFAFLYTLARRVFIFYV